MRSQTKVKQQYIPDWVFLGDSSRQTFLSWLIPGMDFHPGKTDLIWVCYATCTSVSRSDQEWIIHTPMVLPQMVLCFPPLDMIWTDLDLPEKARWAVLEEFPFRKQSSIELIHQMEEMNREVLVVLMDLPRHQASTDLLAPGVDIARAVQAYQSDHMEVYKMKPAARLWGLLHWRRSLYDVWYRKMREDLEQLDQRIEELPIDYEFIIEDWMEKNGPLNTGELDSLLSYRTVKREKAESIWDCYASVIRRFLFPAAGQGPMDAVEELYIDCLNNPLVFWSANEDGKNLLTELKNLFEKLLDEQERKYHYRTKTKISGQLDENGYLKLAVRNGQNGTALNAAFRSNMEKFLREDVFNCMKTRLCNRYSKLENMVYEKK